MKAQRHGRLLGAAMVGFLLCMPATAQASNYTFTTIAAFIGFGFGAPSINNAGTVAFFAGGPGIFTGSGGPANTIADTSDGFSGFGESPSINTGGTVAFEASLKAVGQGIFTAAAALLPRLPTLAERLASSVLLRSTPRGRWPFSLF